MVASDVWFQNSLAFPQKKKKLKFPALIDTFPWLEKILTFPWLFVNR